MRASVVSLCAVLALALVAAPALGDIYINSPRGSNNRLDEANRDRDNGDRLFDSQNNNRGGYNVGSVYYYTGSTVTFEWTAQHSCGDKTRQTCELILQYTCDDRLRDGTTTTTIPTNPNDCYGFDCDTDLRFGRHESFLSYQSCKNTMRNRGLFTGSQNLNADTQQYTRQNPGGTRRGYECPEERDHYPYWQPTIWRDIAVLTNNPERCAAYQAESQNVKPKSYCYVPAAMLQAYNDQNKAGWIPISQSPCEALSWFDPAKNATVYGQWRTQSAWGIPAPVCRENQWSRDNHHGNVVGSGGFMASFNWTVPADLVHERCAARLRYNISTNDIVNWNNATIQAGYMGDFAANPLTRRPQANRDPATLPLWESYRLNYTDVAASFTGTLDATALKASREYVMKNNPRVDFFGSLLPPVAKAALKTQLAINTAQYGRTFQDRTHRFAIRTRPASIPSDAVIHNLQVRGKRGNIVQVYPGVEYYFTPNRLNMQQGDYVHIQWTGSNTNPNNNAGQGLEGTDRSNIVVLHSPNYDDKYAATNPPTLGIWGNAYPGRVDGAVPFLGLSLSDQTYLATLQWNRGMENAGLGGAQFGGSMDELNDAGTYFDMGPRQVTQAGVYHYLSTRNNAFSNRSQKGKIVVSSVAARTEAIGVLGGKVLTAGDQGAHIEAGTFTGLQMVTAAATPRESANVQGPSHQASDFMELQFDAEGLAPGAAVTFSLNYDNSPLHITKLKRASSLTADDWETASGDFSGGRVEGEATQPGVYAVTSKLNGGAVAGIVIGILVFLAAVTFIVWKVYTRSKAGGGPAVSNSAKAGLPMTDINKV